MLLTKEQILDASDLPHEDVDVPEWGGTVRVRTMTGTERDAWESSISRVENGKAVPDTHNLRAKLAVRVLIGEDGQRLFTRSEIDALAAKSAKPLDRIFDVAARLSGLSDAAQASAEKNSAETSADSISA